MKGAVIISKKEIKQETIAGLTTAFALVPESIAFAFVLGIDPMIGLYTSFIIGIVISFIGGRPGLISGAAGSVAVVFVPLVIQHGVEYLFYGVFIMGIIQLVFGILNLNRFAMIIPKSVMLGFVNGLAIIIFKSQLELFHYNGELISSILLVATLVIICLTMIIIYFGPRIFPKIPVQLVAIVIVTIFSIIMRQFGIDLLTVEDFAGKKLTGGLPTFHLPGIQNVVQATLIVFPYAIMAAFVGIIETILTVNLVDEKTKTSSNTKKESIAQGIANITCSLFSGMGGCAMVGQTVVNINAGGRRYLSSGVTALTILVFIIFLPNVLALIPLAVLMGIMFMVVYETFAWETIYTRHNIKQQDMSVIIITTILTITTNLGLAVMIGIIISSLIFVWEKAQKIEVKQIAQTEHQVEYKISGVLFFGAIANLKQQLELEKTTVIFDLSECRLQDFAAINAIEAIAKELQANNQRLILNNLSMNNQDKLISHSDYQFIVR